ncbi:hypothetical protein GGH12_001887 [Coemansia sp. RSA 1822]|nr:hypothetical protein LPJ76_004693 [Coemansia sp. RSA 638]KAJ2544693.1 hypothetical protein GGF49_001043 [Coemansia sp. RSA 1853]KAJ2564566.1 hypothetical protein GGH12_001887 [Coemansia sp. RSA 1822]
MVTQRSKTPYSAEEISKAVVRLRRKLERYIHFPRTLMKLEAMWSMYMEVRSGSSWRVDAAETDQFLQAILRSSVGTLWCDRAQMLADELDERPECSGASPKVTMALIRVLAKFGDVQRVNAAVQKAEERHGLEWSADVTDYIETRVIAYARADLPKQAAEMLEKSNGRKAAAEQKGCTKPVHPYAVALRELMLAWTRGRDADRAWACLSQLLALGYGRATREWNAMLHVHAVDMRYRFHLLEQVLGRMRSSGVKYDAATYNIMMHGSLLRGLQARWKEWFHKMEKAGHTPNAVTFTTLLVQLAHSGQWSEALQVVRYMRQNNVAATAATTASVLSMERQRNRVNRVMSHFRRQVLKGGEIAVSEFTVVVAAILDSPKKWVSETALAIRCLEDRRISESAVVDALAARLPGIGTSRIPDRPLLSLLQDDAGRVAGTFMRGIQGTFPESEPRQLAVGAQRRSFVQTLNVVIRFLLRSHNWEQAEALMHTASEAQINTTEPHTLVSLLHWCSRSGHPQLPELKKQIAAASFVPPPALATAQLVSSIKSGDMATARVLFGQLEQQTRDFPSIRAFNAQLMYASATQDAELLESTWRKMESRGIMPDSTSHRTRIFCYSQMDNLLRTRRAYSDMLDYGNPPTFPAVSAMVRCCVRKGDMELALHVMRHAEHSHGTALNTTTYNYVLSRAGGSIDGMATMHGMFASMLRTSDERICSALSDVERAVEREKMRFADLRVLKAERDGLGSWLLRPAETRESSARLRRALAKWTTSRVANSAEPTLVDNEPHNASDATAPAADSPPPNATTFIIVMRASGQHAQWLRVVQAWEALASFNHRIDALATHRVHAATHRIAPFSRMVGWTALALTQLGRHDEAKTLWAAASETGVLSPSARKMGMEKTVRQLPVR